MCDPIFIPEEIISEILSRLPAKALLQFKCVSKSWLSLISSSQFAKTHLNVSSKSNSNSNYSLVFFSNAYPEKSFTCPFSSILTNTTIDPTDFDFHWQEILFRIYGTCNGLLCVSSRSRSLFLCNPTTRKFKNLMVPEDVPMKPTTTYGFFYDKLNDDYKVVRLSAPFDYGNDYETKAKVYSLRDDCWREIDGFKGAPYPGLEGISVGGMIHWSCFTELNGYSNKFIISLNIATYEYGVVLLPDYHMTDCDKFHWSLGEFGGCLGVICDYWRVRVDIWVMKEYGVKESWFKLESIPYGEDPESHIVPISVSRNGECILNRWALDNSPNVLVYNSRNCSMRKLRVRSSVGDRLMVFGPPYIESLVPLTLEG